MKNLEKSNIYFDSDINIDYIHSMIYEKLQREWTYYQSENNLFRVLYISEGEYYAFINEEQVKVRAGDVLYIPKGLSYHSKSISKTFSYISVFFDTNDKANSYTGFFKHYHLLSNMNKIKHKFEQIYQEYTAKTFGFKLSVKTKLYDILNSVLLEKMLNDNSFYGYYTIKNAIRYIEKNYINENIDVNYLASLCNITPTYFIKLFKEIYKTTPKNYIIELRIDKAKEMLKYSDYSISEISYQLGYLDPAYFSATFKKKTGLSPFLFRRS